MYGWGFWLLSGVSLVLAFCALIFPGITRSAVNVVVLLTLLSLAAFLRPFDGVLGTYSEAAKRYVQDKDVWVSCNFRAHDEGDRFMLPSCAGAWL